MPDDLHEDRYTVLIVDDHESTRDTLTDVVKQAGHSPVTAKNAVQAFERIENDEVDIVFTDLKLPDPDVSGLEIVDRVKRDLPGVPVVLITAHGSEDVAVSAMKRGATDYLSKPLDLNRFRATLEGTSRLRRLHVENQGLHRELDSRKALGEIVGESAAVKAIKEQIRQVAPTNASVLIQGANGTGKELVANAIYAASERVGKPYVKVAVAALPQELLESELFGHEKGAFTGAHKRRKGRFERANGGTLFLDEIGAMPTATQVKLLRAIQEREYERVGGTETIKADIRLICATNEDLEKAMAEGRFRQDLYYRINVIHIQLPPLKDRKDDVPLLVKRFVEEFPSRDGSVKEVRPEVMEALRVYDWPGNVRELRNALESLCITTTGPVIEPGRLPPRMRPPPDALSTGAGQELPGAALVGLSLAEIEARAVEATFRAVEGNKTRAAKLLGITLKTFYRKLVKYKIPH
ncbi:MAG: sigma-54-dependent transcriptional regulator [Planctomycetota bacterium]